MENEPRVRRVVFEMDYESGKMKLRLSLTGEVEELKEHLENLMRDLCGNQYKVDVEKDEIVAEGAPIGNLHQLLTLLSSRLSRLDEQLMYG
jgi:hypothetical protein